MLFDRCRCFKAVGRLRDYLEFWPQFGQAARQVLAQRRFIVGNDRGRVHGRSTGSWQFNEFMAD